MSDKKIEYGVVYETEDFEVWYEPITDEIDGFVIRNKDDEHSVVKVYMPTKIILNRKPYCLN